MVNLQVACIICKEWEPGGMESRKKVVFASSVHPLRSHGGCGNGRSPSSSLWTGVNGCSQDLGEGQRGCFSLQDVSDCSWVASLPSWKVLDESQVNGYFYLTGGDIKRLDYCTSIWSLWNPWGGLCSLSAVVGRLDTAARA